MAWIVAQVKKNNEVNVMTNIRQIGYDALVPRENQQIRTGGEWETKEHVLFPNYVFIDCKFDASVYYQLIKIPGVIKILGDPRQPVSLDFLESEWIRLLGNGGNILESTVIAFQDDGTYQIKKGMLLNFKSRITTCQKRQKKATFEISILGDVQKISLSIITEENETSEN